MYHHPPRAAKHFGRRGASGSLGALGAPACSPRYPRAWAAPGTPPSLAANAQARTLTAMPAIPETPTLHIRQTMSDYPKIKNCRNPDVARAGSFVIKLSVFRTVERLAFAAHGLGFQMPLAVLAGAAVRAHGHIVGDGEQQRDGGDARDDPGQRIGHALVSGGRCDGSGRGRLTRAATAVCAGVAQSQRAARGGGQCVNCTLITAHRQQLGLQTHPGRCAASSTPAPWSAQRYTVGVWCSVALP